MFMLNKILQHILTENVQEQGRIRSHI